MDYFKCPPDVCMVQPADSVASGSDLNCDYHSLYNLEDELAASDNVMDFSIVSSMIVQKLFPTIVEQEVTSTVNDGPSIPFKENRGDKLPPPPPMLPPCRVCSEKASGFHYGANTCEACKGFFRRSLQRKDSYRCTADKNCKIGQGKRNVCAYCRYQKCLSVGMSKNAIKTGRYTHEKKTRDINEVKKLQRRHEQIHSGRPITTEDMISEEEDLPPEPQTDEDLETIISHITAVHKQQTPHTPEFFQKLPKKEKEFLEQRTFQQKMFGPLKPIPKEEYMKIYQSTGIDVDGRREMIKHMIPCIEKAIKRFICFAKSLPGFKDLPINDQISLIKGSRFEAWLISAYKTFNVDYFLFTHVCGYTLHIEEMSKVHDLDFLQSLFKVAGRMSKLRLTTEEECILKGISILSRASKSDAWLIATHRCFNTEHNLFTPLFTPTTSLEEMSKIHNTEYLEKMFTIARRIKSMELTLEETVTLASFNMLFADRVDLEDREKVEEAQALLMRALSYLFAKNNRSRCLIGNCISILTEMRTLGFLRKKEEEKFVLDWSDKLEFPQLMYEMWST